MRLHRDPVAIASSQGLPDSLSLPLTLATGDDMVKNRRGDAKDGSMYQSRFGQRQASRSRAEDHPIGVCRAIANKVSLEHSKAVVETRTSKWKTQAQIS